VPWWCRIDDDRLGSSHASQDVERLVALGATLARTAGQATPNPVRSWTTVRTLEGRVVPRAHGGAGRACTRVDADECHSGHTVRTIGPDLRLQIETAGDYGA
jgi:hypothetical protein